MLLFGRKTSTGKTTEFPIGDDGIPVTTTPRSVYTGFSLAIWRGVAGQALGLDPDPNADEPSADHVLILSARRGAVVVHGNPAVRYVGIGGTTAITIVAWFYDDNRRLWVRFAAPLATIIDNGTGNPSTAQVPANMLGAKWFPQITVNASTGIQQLGYDFT